MPCDVLAPALEIDDAVPVTYHPRCPTTVARPPSSSLPQPRRMGAPLGPGSVSTLDTSAVRPGSLPAFELYRGPSNGPESQDLTRHRRRRPSLTVIWLMPELVRHPGGVENAAAIQPKTSGGNHMTRAGRAGASIGQIARADDARKLLLSDFLGAANSLCHFLPSWLISASQKKSL